MENYTVLTTPNFDHEIKKLKKRYPKIVDDYEEFLDEIEINGDSGEDIPGVIKDGNKVFKKRMKNTSANKGLSGGFRIIEYLVTDKNTVYLLDIYSKSDQENISKKKITRLIRENKHYMFK
jgi:mRNA-degrading endonuclease RelE of RelBE toxin-antitoxin system